MRLHFGRGSACGVAWRAAVVAVAFVAVGRAATAEPLVRVTFAEKDGAERAVEGRVLVEAQDGGVLVQGRDGVLWTVTPERLRGREAVGGEFEPLSAEELGEGLLAEFGDGFEIVRTKHYVICTSAGARYAQWCGGLFERLMGAFRGQWRGLELDDPEFPLPAVVFRDAAQFAAFAAKDAGAGTAESKGYYSIRTNRVVLYDLTAGTGGRPPQTPEEFNARLATSAFNVATVVHEATHQIAFNSGLHRRYADNPVWLTEGMAMYFETPDLTGRTGWKTVGRVNAGRLRQFRDYARNRREAGSLESLLADNARFSEAETAGDAYAEAWALTHFLIKTRRKEYEGYLRELAEKRPLFWDEREERLAEFRAAFGEDLEKLDGEFVRYVGRLR